jgi:hypothetical protein
VAALGCSSHVLIGSSARATSPATVNAINGATANFFAATIVVYHCRCKNELVDYQRGGWKQHPPRLAFDLAALIGITGFAMTGAIRDVERERRLHERRNQAAVREPGAAGAFPQ